MSTDAFDPKAHVHRRYNPLTDSWVLVSPHRTARPWQGQTEPSEPATLPSYDPGCYLCPGNARAGGATNPDYAGTYVFDNDFAALRPQPLAASASADDLLLARPETGLCRVICYSPAHDQPLGRMAPAAIRRVVDTWIDEYMTLGARADIVAVTIFENRGAMMGASNPHPHGQVWANGTIPDEVARESRQLDRHHADHGGCLLCAYLAREIDARERIVLENDEFVAVVPFWAVWPFETLVLPRVHAASIENMPTGRRDALALLLRDLTTRYDRLFGATFPYTMGLHQQPTDGGHYPGWHWHAHFYPPLLRSATVRKFMVGYEMLANPQRDITAEVAAERLRAAGAG